MWRLLRYGAVFAAGQAFQHLMERRQLELLERGETDLFDQVVEAGLEALDAMISRLEERAR